jgi:hypothetical protein
VRTPTIFYILLDAYNHKIQNNVKHFYIQRMINYFFSIGFALITLIIGFFIGKKYNRDLKQEFLREEVERIIVSLSTEILLNSKLLEEGWKPYRNTQGVTMNVFQNILNSKHYENLVNSGKLHLLSQSLQLSLNNYYGAIESLNTLIKVFPENSMIPKTLRKNLRDMRGMTRSLREITKKILDMMDDLIPNKKLEELFVYSDRT